MKHPFFLVLSLFSLFGSLQGLEDLAEKPKEEKKELPKEEVSETLHSVQVCGGNDAPER
jgi:hypothetical protein